MRYAVRWMTVLLAVALVAGCTAPPDMAGHWSTWEDGYAEFVALYGDDPVVLPSGVLPASASVEENRYIISNRGVLRGLEAAVARRGDRLLLIEPAAGFAVVETEEPRAYARFASLIIPDVTMQWREPVERSAGADLTVVVDGVGDPPLSGSADFLFDLQWGHAAVGATAAWAEGVRGQNVRVAVIDGGFPMQHPDLVPNIDFLASRNFVLGETLQYCDPAVDFPGYQEYCSGRWEFTHGGHVAGTIAAAQNDFGIIGVAPDAELILVKALSDFGSGSFSGVARAIVWAAAMDADIINMSLGSGAMPKQDPFVAALRVYMQRVANFATWRGSLLVASAGNALWNYDGPGASQFVVLPAQLQHVVTVSATAPFGWATYFQPGSDPFGYPNVEADYDRLAWYSNYGASGIDVSAPGGDDDWGWWNLYPTDLCLIGPIVNFCYVFDLVFSTGNAGGGRSSYYWSAGTSMASPHAAGVAALILSEHGGSGSLSPMQLEAELKARGTTYGRWAPDPVHGMGAVQSGY